MILFCGGNYILNMFSIKVNEDDIVKKKIVHGYYITKGKCYNFNNKKTNKNKKLLGHKSARS